MRKWLSPFLYATGYFNRHRDARSSGGGFTVVLCYHRVTQRDAGSGLLTVERGLAPGVFEAQIRFMLRRFEPILPREIPDAGGRAPLRFAVTFDDGYEDNATVAVPILERLGVKAAFYVVTEFVGTDRRFWWERLAAMLRATRLQTLDMHGLVPGFARDSRRRPALLKIADANDKEQAHRMLCDALRPLPPDELADTVERLQERFGVRVSEQGRDFPLMDWDRLRALSRRGVEVGCHTANHHNLDTASAALVSEEVVGAARRMKAELGEAPRTFAYPYGFCSRHAADVVRDAGFSLAFAEGSGVVDGRSSPYALPRVELNRRWPFAVSYNIHSALVGASAG